MSFKERLAKMNETWAANKEERGGSFNDAFEDGLYSFQLQSFRLRESSSSGEVMAVVEHYCLDGGPGGEVYTQFFNLEKTNDDGKIWGQVFLAQTLEKLGYELPEDLGDLEETVAEIEADAPKYTARVKTSGQGYKNFAIVRVTEQKAEFEGERPEPTASDGNSKPRPSTRPAPAARTPAEPAEAEEGPDIGSPAPEGEETEEGAEDLAAFCEAWDLKSASGTAADMLSEIRTYEWKAADLTPDEIKMLNQHGVPIVPKAAPRPVPAPAPKPAARPAPRPAAKAAAAARPKPGRAASARR